jgi:hypothetical protein
VLSEKASMHKIINVLAAALLVAVSIGHTDATQRRARKPSAQQLAAEQAWPEFFKEFRVAVSKRDRARLKEMMVRDFFFSGGGGDDNHNDDTRDEAFKFLDDPQTKGWQAFDSTLAKGAVPSPPNPNGTGEKHISRVAPPAALRARTLNTAPPWIAFFEFRDGHWYCTSFSECCD